MSIAKVIEIISEGDSVEEAVKEGVKEASKTIRNIKSVYVDSIQAVVKDGKVDKYRVNSKVTFVVS